MKSKEQSKENTGLKGTRKKRVKSLKGLRKQRTLELKDSPKFWDEVWEMFECGANPLLIAEAYDIPKMSLYNWIRQDPEKAQKVEEYRQMRADSSADSIILKVAALDKVFQKQIEEGNPNPALGKLIFNMWSWDAAKGNPDKFGDKRKLEISQDTRVQHVQQLRDLNKQKKIKDITPEKKVIEKVEREV